jgi:hypothetical protein
MSPSYVRAMGGTTANETPERKQRLRIPKNLPTPPSGEQPFAKRRDELKKVTEAEIVLLVIERPEWAQAMKPMLDTLDMERAEARLGKPGGRPAYSAEEIEKALLFQKVCGYRTYKKAHMHLCADLKSREMLGFTRANAKAATRYATGVPSRATVSRHLRRFGHERRGAAWDALARLLRDFHVVNFPEMQEEMRVTNVDGSRFRTHHTTPLINPKTGVIENADDVTCWDGGHLPPSAGERKCGNGWKLLPFASHTSIPWAWPALPPMIHKSEVTEAINLVFEDVKDVLALIPERKLGLITMDGGFTSQHLREVIREIGFIENCHPVSHRKQSEERAAEFREKRIPIEGYPHWFADGHRQLHCGCGEGHLFSRTEMNRKGKTICRVEGACKTCGSITITSGKWKLAKNPTHCARVDPSNPDEEPDFLFGNPFTFDDPLANQFGNRRFGHNEGLFGTLWKRWRFGEKRWYRTVYQAQAEIGMVFSIIHVVAMEQRTRKEQLTLAPPGTP